MIINYRKLESIVKPELIDTTSSKTTIYLRRNIIEKIKNDEVSKKVVTCYEYEEAKLTKTEYQQYLAELDMMNIKKQRADIDYLFLMLDIPLDD